MRFEVTDTGIGLSAEEIKKLFQPFVQADTSSSRKFGGTGLGLAISRKIVELMGGRIGVQSAAGHRRRPSGLKCRSPCRRSPPSNAVFPAWCFCRRSWPCPIRSQRQSLVEQLQSWGVVCRAVADAKELGRSLRHDLRAAVIPLVICDDEMLALGGEDLRRLLAANQERVQCILLASPAGSLGADAAGLDRPVHVLLKPVREQPLFDALVAVVTGIQPELDRQVEALATQTEQLAREPGGPKRTAISDVRILVAEDHPFNRKLCHLMLENFGARAEWAVNGREAVEKFSPGQCDAILMDCNMPELDGFEATAAIRKIEVEKKVARPVRIIALTANALVGERERCLAAGMDDYIAKPFTTQQLFNALLAAAPPAAGNGNGNVPVAETFSPVRLEQLCNELERGAVMDMVGDFLNEFPDRLAEIRRLAAAGQWPELERAAHSLKGLVALFGFPKLSEQFLAIEDGAEAADAGRVKTALADLDALAGPAAQQLRGWLKNNRRQAGV